MHSNHSIRDDVIEVIFRPMRDLFRPPLSTTDQVAALEEYLRHLVSFCRIDLREGWSRVVQTHRSQTWPTVAEILQHCRAAREHRLRSENEGAFGVLARDQAERRRREALCETVLRSPLGRQACSQGWPSGLSNFVEREGRPPDQIEVKALQSAKRKADALMKDLECRNDKLAKANYQLGIRLRARAARLGEQYHPEASQSDSSWMLSLRQRSD